MLGEVLMLGTRNTLEKTSNYFNIQWIQGLYLLKVQYGNEADAVVI